MTEFKIIEDTTLNFIDKEQLYLMLIKEEDNYYIEVDSKTVRIGKRKVRSRKEADIVFDQMQKRLCSYFDVGLAFEMLDLAFAMSTIREHMFLVNNLNREVSFNEIWKFKRQYLCETTPVIADLIYEDKQYDRTIYITFPGRKEPLGYFKAPEEDADFRFYLSDTYRFRI